jgi:hypothetical protein
MFQIKPMRTVRCMYVLCGKYFINDTLRPVCCVTSGLMRK